jgi:hypothetical protein
MLNRNPFTFQSLFNNVAFGFGCRAIAEYEQSAVGVKWSNIMDSGRTIHLNKNIIKSNYYSEKDYN